MAFNHNDHYHPLLLKQIPEGAGTALDVGCGTGRFARLLAGRGLEVDAIDSSPEAIEMARSLPGSVRYEQADIALAELPSGRYDFVSCLASIHHVPFETVSLLRGSLAPGGVLAILGCYRESTPADYATSLCAVPVNAVARLLSRTGAKEEEMVVAKAMMTLPEIKAEAATLLPGASIRRLLFWRYLLVYRA
ncbi:class I SAM-dependent methyltransferase [Nonomuraea guangzhouensis]|uniref:Class I SAM-dependent methyltransferase n=1 Tax=Nonomuraea guangzhouensis TaxID=1291555 RepID=A0ABW4G0T8_9ACTN|nr:class I SAM-dependent methyltransferase [Nonomuraea guangzhouensis]